jgi:DNA-binding transcriptional LysR family regulator
MRLEQLRYFVAVAEELHFRRAAERLLVSQPPLSFHIKALEAEFGVELLRRSTRSVSLTEAGEMFLVSARRILREVDELSEVMKDLLQGKNGHLHVGFTISSSFHPFFFNAVQTYRRLFPRVSLSLSEMLSDRQIDALLEDRIDVGFLRGQFRQIPGLTMQPLTQDALVLAVHHTHRLASQAKVSLASLRTEPFICYPANAGVGIYRQVLALCGKSGFEPRVIQEALEPSLTIGLVAAGLGVAIVPSTLMSIQIANVAFLTIDDVDAVTTLYLSHRSDNLRPQLRAFCELVSMQAVQAAPGQAVGDRAVAPT